MSIAVDLKRFICASWLNVLLVFIPISGFLQHRQTIAVWVFAAAALALVPLAGLIGHATEVITEHTGPGVGGLLNATFGNAPELIFAFYAVRAGLYGIVKASITGSILSNMLLVLGVSMVAGGWGGQRQRFSHTAAAASAAMLMLAVTALVMPAVWNLVETGDMARTSPAGQLLSLLTAVILLVTYAASLLFSLTTHRDLLATVGDEELPKRRYRLASALALLLLAAVFTAFESEILVAAIRPAAVALGLTQLFIGVVIVAVAGNAAEHSSAITVAAKGRMDLAFHIAMASSTQVALLVAPVLVVASFLRSQPMDLVFQPLEIVALAMAVLNVAIASRDGESNWFKGVQLIAVYLVLALAFYFAPG
jgi:Ca2+:H+ antiporter